jgi:hypothetical protein
MVPLGPRRGRLASLGLLAGMLVASVLAYPSLPARIAVHFGASGTPEGFLAKPAGVLVLPGFAALLVALSRYGGASPLRSGELTPGVLVVVTGSFAYLHLVVIAWNFGVGVPPVLAVLPAVVAVLVAVVYASARGGATGD